MVFYSFMCLPHARCLSCASACKWKNSSARRPCPWLCQPRFPRLLPASACPAFLLLSPSSFFFLGWDNPPAPVLQFFAPSPCSCALLRDLFFSLCHQKEDEQQGSHGAQSTKGAVPALPLHSS